LIAGEAHASSAAVGVHVGDYFQYEVGPCNSSSELYEVDTFTITVTNIIGTTVYANETRCCTNGTFDNIPGYVDLINGDSTIAAWILINANLSVGDPMYPSWPMTPNETITVNGRATDHLTMDNAYANVTDGPQGYMTTDICCDQITGVAVNVSLCLTGEHNQTFAYSLMATNVWTIVPEFSTLMLCSLMSAVLIGTAILNRKRNR
jgi:hypothetical protein